MNDVPTRGVPSAHIGFHVSIAGGLPGSVDRALERDCTAFQIFCGNPRGWKLQDRGSDELERFRRDRKEADLRPLAVHACYLINPCSQDETVLYRSVRRLTAELELSAEMGAELYVLHPGSHKGRPLSWGLHRAKETIGRALAEAKSRPTLLLEDTASAHGPGGSLETLGALIHSLDGDSIGVALDSCHLFGAGYDVTSEDEVDRLVEELEAHVGLARVKLLHVNDSRDPPGSRRDRHTHIGKGTIGKEGLRNFLNHPAFRDRPKILETPWESVETDLRNLRAIMDLLR